MISDFAFPGTLLALKLLLRVIVHQEFKKVELYKTVLAFPTDVVYLAFTFSAAVLVNSQKSGHQISDVKSFYSATVWIFISTVLVIALSRESLKRFDSESDSSKGHFPCFLIAMAISLFTLGTSTFMIGTI